MMISFLSLSFLIIALASIFLYVKSSHEVTKMLAAASVIIFLLSGFILAHWSIHLLLLLLLLNIKVSPSLLEAVRIEK